MKKEMLDSLLAELDWSMPTWLSLCEGGEGISLVSEAGHVTLTYRSPADLARGLVLAKQYGNARAYVHTEKNAFETLGVMIDCSRNALFHVEGLKRTLRLLALMGYNMVQLYTEDTYEVEGQPYFGYLRGRYSCEEMREIDEYAAALGIEVIPCIQTLAHLGAIFHWREYAGVRDCDDILLCNEEKTYALIDAMLSTVSKCFRSRRIHIGMDEAHMVGLGKFLDKNGFHDRFDILTNHLHRVCALAEKYGYQPMIWSDMYFRLANDGDYYLEGKKCEIPERVFSSLPQNISLVYWDYYHKDRKAYDEMNVAHKRFGREIWFAGGAWCWCGFAPDNTNSFTDTIAATKSCIGNGIRHFFTTAWGDNGAECTLTAVLPTLAYTASLAYGKGAWSAVKRFFRTLTGMRFDDFMSIDLLNKLNGDWRDGCGKYYLYNDVLMGILDRMTVDYQARVSQKLAEAIPDLSRCARNKRFGYLFRTQKSLAALLQVKFDFGIRLRAAYRAGDREAMAACLADCDVMLRLLDRFIHDFRAQWERERKPHGFDVQDIRLGGLAQRIKACREILREFLDGKRDSIPELEEEILPASVPNLYVWSSVATANRL